jgi:uncharacterized damage-inducible protein DinB
MSTQASEARPAPEPWLRGPVPGVPDYLMPAAHALIQAEEEASHAAAGLAPTELWARPGGAASVGFHLRHIVGATDRLLTYARGESLNDAQRAALAAEGEAGDESVDVDDLLAELKRSTERALEQIRHTPPETLLEPRGVGRKQLPSTVLGLISHVADHAMRHAGQVVATAKIVRGARA